MLPDFLIIAAASAPAEAADPANPLQGIVTDFKIHWVTFVAQLVNFIIVAIVLKKFAFGPILGVLEKRKSRIADGEAKLKEVEQQIAESEKNTQIAIQEANERAKRLVEEAKASATAVGEKKTQEATAAAQAILAKAEEAAKSEQEKMRTELRKEFGRLVTATTAQVTGKVLNDDDQRRINDEALAKVEG